MREFDYKKQCENILSTEIVSLLTRIYEFKGRINQYIVEKEDTLFPLVEIAKIQNVEASNRMEGVSITNDRFKKIVLSKTMPKSRNEEEIAGYRDALSTICENYAYIPIKPSIILQMHRDLYKFSSLPASGTFKSVANHQETDQIDKGIVRCKPVEVREIPSTVEKICDSYTSVLENNTADPLLASAMFILDFLCVQPFSEGNGRMSRLLTALLLFRSEFMIGKYISLDRRIEKSKQLYFESLRKSAVRWHEGINTYEPFVKYLLGIIVTAYSDLSDKTAILGSREKSKPQMVADYIKSSLDTVTKSRILKQFPDISQVTVQRALKDLTEKGDIIKLGGGRYTSYIWNREKA